MNANSDWEAADEAKTTELERLEQEGEDTDGWRKVYYNDHWEFVTACFTEQACKDFLTVNGHNLNEPRIYAASSYRNVEFRSVRTRLMHIGTLDLDGLALLLTNIAYDEITDNGLNATSRNTTIAKMRSALDHF